MRTQRPRAAAREARRGLREEFRLSPYMANAVLAACRGGAADKGDAGASERARDVCGRVQRMRARCARTRVVHVGLWGFSNVAGRDALLRVLRVVWRVRVLHASQTQEGRFEAFLIAAVDIGAEEEAFLASFGLSADACVLQDNAAECGALCVACLDRINRGTQPFGNWDSQAAQSVRWRYDASKRADASARERQQVLSLTGLPFSPNNTLHLFSQLGRAVARQRSRLVQVRESLIFSIDALADQLQITVAAQEHLSFMVWTFLDVADHDEMVAGGVADPPPPPPN